MDARMDTLSAGWKLPSLGPLALNELWFLQRKVYKDFLNLALFLVLVFLLKTISGVGPCTSCSPRNGTVKLLRWRSYCKMIMNINHYAELNLCSVMMPLSFSVLAESLEIYCLFVCVSTKCPHKDINTSNFWPCGVFFFCSLWGKHFINHTKWCFLENERKKRVMFR